MVLPQYRIFLGILVTGILGCNAFVVQQNPVQPKHHALAGISRLSERQRSNQLLMPSKPIADHHYRAISSQRHLGLASLQEPITKYLASLLRNTGGVPFAQAFSINALGICLLLKPLSKMLTGEGIIHALILGTSLWKTLGWRGWSVCVAYLFAGSLVTKIGFKKKDKLGIAEGRGGKRGPENLWYVR